MTSSYGKQITNGSGMVILLVDRAESTEVFRIPSPTRGTATETRHHHGVGIPLLALCTPRAMHLCKQSGRATKTG